MFTRQHYKAIAEVLKANQPGEIVKGWTLKMKRIRQAALTHHQCIADQLANLFVQDNNRFNWDRFMNAAGFPD